MTNERENNIEKLNELANLAGVDFKQEQIIVLKDSQIEYLILDLIAFIQAYVCKKKKLQFTFEKSVSKAKKLTETINFRMKIRHLYKSGSYTVRSLASEFNCSPSMIHNIINSKEA